MKKKLLFTFACVMALMAGFVSCTNDDFEEFAPVAEMQKSAMTRAVGGMTQEEVQARLDELGEKYGININMLYVRDYSEFKESTFEKMEQNIIAYKNRAVNTNAVTAQTVENDILDDSVIDEYEIATLSTNAEAIKSYDATLDFRIFYKYPGGYIHERDDYTVRWGLNFKRDIYDNITVQSDFFDVDCITKRYDYNINVYLDSNIEYSNINGHYFEFHLDIFVNNILGSIYGTYNDGFENVYAFSNDVSLIIGIVEPK